MISIISLFLFDFFYPCIMGKNVAILLFILLACFALYSTITTTIEDSVTEVIAPMVETNPVDTIEKKEPITLDTSLTFSPADTFSFVTDKNGVIQLDWKMLGHIKFNEQYTPELDAYVPYPIFHPIIKQMEGKYIQIKGYIIPIDEVGDDKLLVLSAYPFTNCFFCGGAGPETVMDIHINETTKRFKQDAVTTFKGKLKLNDSDLYYLNYILEDAELVK